MFTGTIKPNPFEKGHEPKPGGEEDSDIEGDIKEQPTPNDQETFHQDNSRQEQAMSEAEVGFIGRFDLFKVMVLFSRPIIQSLIWKT